MQSSYDPEYNAWAKAIQRCHNPNNPGYQNYGGRGIIVCDRWRGKGGFKRFILDMGRKPSPGHSLDRINNDGNYDPSNCRWTTKRQQCSNTRRSRYVFVDEVAYTHTQLAEKLNISISAISHRVSQGWSGDQIFSYYCSPKTTMADWARYFGISSSHISYHRKIGKTDEEIIMFYAKKTNKDFKLEVQERLMELV